MKALKNEILILKKLTHERIVSYHGSEQKGGHLHLFMDFMAGVRAYMCCGCRRAIIILKSQPYFNNVFACWFSFLCVCDFAISALQQR